MFFEQLANWGARTALIEDDRQVSYTDLAASVDAFKERLPTKRSLVMLKANNSIDTLVPYLACLQDRHPVLLVDEKLSDTNAAELIRHYQPALCIQSGQCDVLSDKPVNADNRLALLLSTSGSTGSPKQVALSAQNLQANAESICAYLPIEPSDCTITTLPFHYSYGLSVIHSHLLRGACIVMNQASVMSREFWQNLQQLEISSFAGVPYTYEMLLRLRFTEKALPSLRYITQAGGKLDAENVARLAQWAQSKGKQFFVMYGQTEATARMAFNNQPLHKPEAIGKAIPGGHFYLKDEQGNAISAPRTEGELVYQGENVMLGYVDCEADLSSLTPPDILSTGDLAWCDEEGDFYISGRLKRFIKPFGQRINLDEVEQLLKGKAVMALVVGAGDRLQILAEGQRSEDNQHLKRDISKWLSLHPSMIDIKMTDALPLLENGKPDYQQVNRSFSHDDHA